MATYIEISANIYEIYLKYLSKEDIHVYSIDEAFMDVTDYLELYGMTAKELGMMIMQDVYQKTGITAACGIGSNLYLAKIALDITAKHTEDHIESSMSRRIGIRFGITDRSRIFGGSDRGLQKN